LVESFFTREKLIKRMGIFTSMAKFPARLDELKAQAEATLDTLCESKGNNTILYEGRVLVVPKPKEITNVAKYLASKGYESLQETGHIDSSKFQFLPIEKIKTGHYKHLRTDQAVYAVITLNGLPWDFFGPTCV